MVALSNASLTDLPDKIAVPHYDRSAITPGIVHIGLGNFHRAHQAWYLHRLMQNGHAMDWGIIGAGVRPNDETQRIRLAAQDYLTTLIELDPKGHSTEVVGSMVGFVPVEDGNGPLIAQLASADIRIVSLTVTEGGYFLDPVTKQFDTTHPDIQHDVAHPTSPRTAFGAMIEALKLRRDSGAGPLTAQSCDNLQGNGDILRQTIVSLARLSDPALADWIGTNCTFPNSMVDCIVPATGPAEMQHVRNLGIEDAAPVTHENFRQWVIEDNFCAGRPPWEDVGATLTHDVDAFEAMKIRLLNGGHQLIAVAGEILSVEHISECMAHPLIGAYLDKVARSEIAPHVADVPGMTPAAYIDLIKERFANPEIVDTVRRVAFDGSSRQTGFVVPTLCDAMDSAQPFEGLALSQALWARMCEGSREDGSQIEANDPLWSALNHTAKAARAKPSAWTNQPALYGSLATDSRFTASFDLWLTLIWEDGVEAALNTYLQGS